MELARKCSLEEHLVGYISTAKRNEPECHVTVLVEMIIVYLARPFIRFKFNKATICFVVGLEDANNKIRHSD